MFDSSGLSSKDLVRKHCDDTRVIQFVSLQDRDGYRDIAMPASRQL